MVSPGKQLLEFDMQEKGYCSVLVVLENKYHQIATLDVSIHANIETLDTLKWFVLIPFLSISALLLFSSHLGTPLPL